MYSGIITIAVIVVIVLIILGGSLFTVTTQTNVIVQRLGKFIRVARPGLNFKIPFVEAKAGRLSLRVQQMDVKVETKSQDNVFTTILVSIQYAIPDNVESVRNAFYKLSQPDAQITSYVFDSVRAKAPNMTLDDIFSKKDEIANEVKDALSTEMSEFGYSIVRALVTDVIPEATVKEAMNRINAAQRLQEAAKYEGEANRIKIVANAQAEADGKKLQGQGIANERIAIINGLKESLDLLQNTGVDVDQARELLLLNQYFDVLTTLGSKGATTILLPGHPGGLAEFSEQIRQSIITGGLTKDSVEAQRAALPKSL